MLYKWILGEIADGLFYDRIERDLRNDDGFRRAIGDKGQILKHPVDITALKEEDLDIVAVYFAVMLLPDDYEGATPKHFWIDCFSNSLQRAENILSTVQHALAGAPVTRHNETQMREEFQGIIKLGDKYTIDNLEVYRLAIDLFRKD